MTRSWLELAVECVELVYNCNSDARKAFRTRARQVPSEIYYVGAAYALAILAARSSESYIFAKGSLSERVENICKSKAEREEMGYALYGTCLLEALRALGIRAESLGSALKELDARSGIVEAELEEFVDWLKKLAEARIEAGK